ncbi:MAG: heat shock protein transcriptional repressor HspR [Dehalococcoidia bacterium]
MIYDDLTEPLYVISVAARMVGVHVQTLRYYERAGLIKPSRSGGNTRFYSLRDVNQLRRIKSLIDDLGVNLAGVEVILRMAQRMRDMESKIRSLEQEVEHLGGASREVVNAEMPRDYTVEKES